jgi:hypothetical protein
VNIPTNRTGKRLQYHFHHTPSTLFYPVINNRLDPHRTDVKQMTTIRIETGTAEGDVLGFTADLFSGWLEMEADNQLTLHYIISRNKNEGNTQMLIRQWLNKGYDVRVVMPRPIMQHILKKFHFISTLARFPDQYEGDVEVWCSLRVFLRGEGIRHQGIIPAPA